MAKYIFRLDDVSWDMNYENFERVKKLFIKYGIRPLIGIIPWNEDEKLKRQTGERRLSEAEFWSIISDLVQNRKWDVALHGYNHVYLNNNSGILGINNRSEFAGVSYECQSERIEKGKKILEDHSIDIAAFMAPAHSFDTNTLRALRANGIAVITDGIASWPYYMQGVLFVPAQWAIPFKKWMGYHTFCLHVNGWGEKHFMRLEKFLMKRKDDCISFSEVVSKINIDNCKKRRMIIGMSHYLICFEKYVFSKLMSVIGRI